jgi:putative ABC transport system substrate-binding protein
VIGPTILTPVFAAFAQSHPAKVPRIGFFGGGTAASSADRIEAFRSGLRELGYIEGKNIVLEMRFRANETVPLSRPAAELVALQVDVIVAASGQATNAAREATQTIPIVMIGLNDPVGSGVIASLSRPGGNITGPTSMGTDVSAKYVEFLREVSPKLSRIALLTDRERAAPSIVNSVQSATKATGVRLQVLQAENTSEIEAAFIAMARERAEALIVMLDPILVQQRSQIAALAMKYRLLTMLPVASMVQAGGLLSYGHDPKATWKRAATYVDKILRGAKPADLPAEQPTTFELVVNMKTAKALGVIMPNTILMRATRVIE